MRPIALATLAVALIASLTPIARGDDKPAPAPPAPAPAAPEKPDEKPQPKKVTRHFFRERVGLAHAQQAEGPPEVPARVELTREQVVEEVARVVWQLNQRRDKDGKIPVSDQELLGAIKEYNEAGGSSPMMRSRPMYTTRILVVETADVTP